MQLTPRTLGMALGACLAGGLVVGAATVISPSIGVINPTPEAAALSPAYSEAELGDIQVTYPTPSMRVATPMSAATPPDAQPNAPLSTTAPTSASTPTLPAPKATPTASQVTKDPSSRDRTKPTATKTSTPTRPTLPPTQAPKPTAIAPAVQGSATHPLHDWKLPHLGIGVTDISAPTLSSGARVHVTVMCSPSSACNASGTSLAISPEATHVSVTWSAPADSKWPAWSLTRAYMGSAAG
ncbi:MAG: hypothetical protein Q7L55_05090 [Actinomycetota bacterium]|nr:hypothetical protein [Actinomycetota bacterium]